MNRSSRVFWPLIALAGALLVVAPLLGGRPVDYVAAVGGYLSGVMVCWVSWGRG